MLQVIEIYLNTHSPLMLKKKFFFESYEFSDAFLN